MKKNSMEEPLILQLQTKLKKIVLLCSVFFILFSEGCTFFNGETDSKQNASHFLCNVSGKIVYSGCVSDVVRNGSSQEARSVYPSAVAQSSLYYKICAEPSEIESTLDSKTFEIGQNTEFSISLTAAKWNITAEAYSDSEYSKKVLSGILCENQTLTKGNFSLGEVSIKPSSEGTGNVLLNFIFDAQTSIKAGTVVFYKTGAAQSNYNLVFSADYSTAALSIENIASGIYKAVFEFTDNNNNLVYRIIESVTVYDNLTSNCWVNNPEYVASDTGKIYLSASLVNSFKLKEFFVKADGNNSSTGSWFSPFKTIQHAVDVIESINDGTSVYTISLLGNISAVLGDCTANDDTGKSFIYLDSSDKQLNLKIRSYGNSGAPYKIDANGTITGARVVYVGQNVALELNDLEITGGKFFAFADADTNNGSGIFVKGKSDTDFSKLNIKNCKIDGNGNSLLENVYTTSNGGAICVINGAIDISDSDISSNTAKHGGGLYAYYQADISIKDTAIWSNKAESTGGGVWLANKSSSISNLIRCQVYNNTTQAGSGGGLYIKGWNNIEDCEIYGNTASLNGGGICVNQRELKIKGVSKIYGNTASKGGGVAVTSESDTSKLTITANSVIKSNISTLENGSEIYIVNASDSKISTVECDNCAVYNDTEKYSVYLDSGILNIKENSSFDTMYTNCEFNLYSAPITQMSVFVPNTYTSGSTLICGKDSYTLTEEALQKFAVNVSEGIYDCSMSLSADNSAVISVAAALVYSNWDALCLTLNGYTGTTEKNFYISGEMTTNDTDGSVILNTSPVKLVAVNPCTIKRGGCNIPINPKNSFAMVGSESAQIILDGNSEVYDGVSNYTYGSFIDGCEPSISKKYNSIKLEYVTIKNCVYSYDKGPALSIGGSNNSIKNCTFENNYYIEMYDTGNQYAQDVYLYTQNTELAISGVTKIPVVYREITDGLNIYAVDVFKLAAGTSIGFEYSAPVSVLNNTVVTLNPNDSTSSLSLYSSYLSVINSGYKLNYESKLATLVQE